MGGILSLRSQRWEVWGRNDCLQGPSQRIRIVVRDSGFTSDVGQHHLGAELIGNGFKLGEVRDRRLVGEHDVKP